VADDEDDGPGIRFQTTLSVEMTNWLKAVAKTRVYGRTVPAVGRSFIETGVRKAIVDGFITKEDGLGEQTKKT
jgi:hypothetical protein